MGLFSNLRKQDAVKTDTARALLAMPLLVAAADGKIDNSELDEIAKLCSQNQLFVRLGAKGTMNHLAALATDLKKRGAQAVFEEAATALTPKLRETALCFAVRVAIADGRIDDSEFEALKVMGQGMGISAERFVQILDVLMMLHRTEAA